MTCTHPRAAPGLDACYCPDCGKAIEAGTSTYRQLMRPKIDPPSTRPANWHQARAAYYQHLINKLTLSGWSTPANRRHEINRLHTLRQEALSQIQ